jgi:hypothetical protein
MAFCGAGVPCGMSSSSSIVIVVFLIVVIVQSRARLQALSIIGTAAACVVEENLTAVIPLRHVAVAVVAIVIVVIVGCCCNVGLHLPLPLSLVLDCLPGRYRSSLAALGGVGSVVTNSETILLPVVDGGCSRCRRRHRRRTHSIVGTVVVQVFVLSQAVVSSNTSFPFTSAFCSCSALSSFWVGWYCVVLWFA